MLKMQEIEGEPREETESTAVANSRLRSVMVVEDDGLLLMMLEDLFRDQGASDIQSCRKADEALCLATSAALDCAVLDVSLQGDASYEIADALAGRNIPFFFCTGLTRDDIVERHRHRPLLLKPYSDREFKAALAAAITR